MKVRIITLLITLLVLMLPVTGFVYGQDKGKEKITNQKELDKATADGGFYFDPTVSLSNQGDGIGLGCWERPYKRVVDVVKFGAKGDGSDDYMRSIEDRLPIGSYYITFSYFVESFTGVTFKLTP